MLYSYDSRVVVYKCRAFVRLTSNNTNRINAIPNGVQQNVIVTDWMFHRCKTSKRLFQKPMEKMIAFKM